MRNIKLTIEYDGTGYAGWQRQKNSRKTIQEIIEKALWKIIGEKARLIVSGRTDAGVHALAQTANFRTTSNIPPVNLKKALNSNLPGDIVITAAKEAPLDFHSRFDAKSKVYRYCILNRDYPSALFGDRACFYRYPLDIKLMQKAARCLLGRRNFKSFCASGGNTKDTVRTIKRIGIKKFPSSIAHVMWDVGGGRWDESVILIDIEADGFLYNMARNIVGTLVEVGRHKIPPTEVKEILRAKDRMAAGQTMPPQGLYLVSVKY